MKVKHTIRVNIAHSVGIILLVVIKIKVWRCHSHVQ
jgi:hypothetical protein